MCISSSTNLWNSTELASLGYGSGQLFRRFLFLRKDSVTHCLTYGPPMDTKMGAKVLIMTSRMHNHHKLHLFLLKPQVTFELNVTNDLIALMSLSKRGRILPTVNKVLDINMFMPSWLEFPGLSDGQVTYNMARFALKMTFTKL